MKYILTTILTLIFASISFLFATNNLRTQPYNLRIQKEILKIRPEIKITDYMIFCSGNNGYNWSCIVKENRDISIFHGSIGRLNDYAKESTYKLSYCEKQMIHWAFDSLPTYSKNIYPKETEYSPVYSVLEIFHDDEQLLSKNQSQNYIGSDSVRINMAIQKIQYLMLYISSPELHHYLKDPKEIFSNR